MTAENQKKYDAKLKRLNDALDCKEPDIVPIDAEGGQFAVNYAGYTMKDCIYDTSLECYKESMKKFMEDFDPDMLSKSAPYFFGEGPGHELTQSKKMIIAGQPGAKIEDNSIHQHLESANLLDEEFDEFFSDRTGWRVKKFLPRMAGIFESFANLNLDYDFKPELMLANEFSKPEVRKTIETLWKISDFYKEKNRKFAEAVKELSELGYPDLSGGSMEVPFDNYSDNYRGTILSLEDIYANDDVVIRYTEEFHQKQLAKIRNMNKDGSKNGKYVSDMLHKGMDGFMSDEVYEKFYWRHLYEMMETVIECGMIPMLFCEGKYDSRIKFLKDAPKGRKLYRFERIDMKAAKAAIGNNACLGGAFPSQLLQFGTKEQVVEETKRLLGEAMPGGGYIFRCSAGLDGGKVENVIAMFETVREYGKY